MVVGGLRVSVIRPASFILNPSSPRPQTCLEHKRAVRTTGVGLKKYPVLKIRGHGLRKCGSASTVRLLRIRSEPALIALIALIAQQLRAVALFPCKQAASYPITALHPNGMFGPLFGHQYSPPLPLIRTFYKQDEEETRGDASQLRVVGAAPGNARYFGYLLRHRRPLHHSACIEKKEGQSNQQCVGSVVSQGP